MANNQLEVSNLDFDSIKTNFKNYLKSQDQFKDYNFDGSSINVLLDVLAYNTFYNAFYTNMASSDMFLDSATQRDAVVSRAKALGYKNSSSFSSFSYVDLEAHIARVPEMYPGEIPTITLNPNASFVTSVQDIEYNFITTAPVNLDFDSDNGECWVYKTNNIKIHEGSLYTYAWKVNSDYNKYIIPNAGVDLNSLVVIVYEDENMVISELYTHADNILTVDSTSSVYWAYEGTDQKFYIEFGNGIIGKKVNIGNIIRISYRVCSGAGANGAKTFVSGSYTYTDPLINDYDGISVTNSSVVNLYLSGVSSDFTANSIIRGEESDTIAYIESYDSDNYYLTVKYPNGDFEPLETIHEEAVVNGETIYGANGIIQSITTDSSLSTGGADIENIDNIKLIAPKFYGAQNRLVTSLDYQAVIKNEFPYVQSVIAWGGEDETPQQPGHIFVSMKPSSREFLTSDEKVYILDSIIEPKKMLGMTVHIVDPDYVYIYPSIDVKYNASASSLATSIDIINDAKEAILNRCNKYCNSFNNSFFYTPFCSDIDNANQFILGNDTTIELLKIFQPYLNSPYSYSLNFSNELKRYIVQGMNLLRSSKFSCDVGGVPYEDCSLRISSDENYIALHNMSGMLVEDVGTIDYTNGLIELYNLNITASDLEDNNGNPFIEVYMVPESNDLVASKNQILKLYSSYILTSTAIRDKK